MEVTLAVYDLSSGLASSLSQQYLGTQIDLVPHTGVVLTTPSEGSYEYFFGGGVQKLRPESFRNGHHIQPLRLTPMGRTEQTLEGVAVWLANNSHRFTASTYNLLR